MGCSPSGHGSGRRPAGDRRVVSDHREFRLRARTPDRSGRLQRSRLTRCCSTSAVRCRYGRAAQPSTSSSISISSAGCSSNQLAHHVGQRRAAADGVQRRGGRRVDDFVPPQDVGDLPNQQPHVVPVEGDLREVEQRLAAGQARVQRFGRRFDPRRGEPALHAAHRFDQIDLQRWPPAPAPADARPAPSARGCRAAGRAIRRMGGRTRGGSYCDQPSAIGSQAPAATKLDESGAKSTRSERGAEAAES